MGQRLVFHDITEREQPSLVGAQRLKKETELKNISEELQETKAFREIPRLPKKRTVTENVCAKPPSSPSFPQGLAQLTLKEKERLERARSISPSCPTLQSPTALLHPNQQAGRNAKSCHL